MVSIFSLLFGCSGCLILWFSLSCRRGEPALHNLCLRDPIIHTSMTILYNSDIDQESTGLVLNHFLTPLMKTKYSIRTTTSMLHWYSLVRELRLAILGILIRQNHGLAPYATV